MANEFIARKGLIALEDSQITGSLGISGSIDLIDGNNNVIIGAGAASALTTAADNVIIGKNAADIITVSPQNVLIGADVGPRYTTGYGSHVMIGYQAGRGADQNNDDKCVIIGHSAGHDDVGFRTVAIGHSSAHSSNSSRTVTIGYESGRIMGSNAENAIYIGYNAGYSAGGGNQILLGKDAGRNADGDFNIALGTNAAYNMGGDSNIAIGYQALYNADNITYNNVVALGHEAGYAMTGSNNLLLGYQAGYNLTGSNQLIIANTGSKHLIRGDFEAETVEITGSLDITSTLTLPGFSDVSASLAAAVAGGDNLGNHIATQDLNMGSNNITSVGNVDGVDVSTLNSSFNTLEGKTLVSSSLQIASDISGSFIAASASFSTRVTANDAKVSYTDAAVTSVINAASILSSSAQISSDISGSFTATSASFSTRVTANDAKVGYTDAAVTSVINAAGIVSSSAQFGSSDNVTFGTIEATSLNVTSITSSIVTSSIVQTEGSNIFGDTSADTHTFTGSLLITGGLDIDSGDSTFRESVQVGKLDRPITLTGGNSFVATRPTIEGGGSSHIDFTTGINLTTEKKISFDSDTTNTYIAANNENPEDLEIHADQDVILNPDGQVIANSHISASGAITASAFKGDGSNLTNLPSQTDQNFTNADHSKLDGIEASADVTDATNVQAAGALMDSELAEIATVKALTAAGISGSFTAASASFSTRVSANEVVTAKTLLSSSAQIASDISGSFTAASASFSTRVTANDAKTGYTDAAVKTKLNAENVISGSAANVRSFLNVEDGADVTDTSNVTSAGALMDSELAEIATVKTLTKAGISGSFTAASASFSTRVTTNDAKVSYTDAAVTSVINTAGIISSSAQIASDISGSFTAASSSFSTRVTANDAKVSYTDAAVKTKINTEGVISSSAQIADVTLTTAAQTNITSVGTLTGLTVDQINLNGNTISSTTDSDVFVTLNVAGFDFEANAGDKFVFNVSNQNNVDFQVSGENDTDLIYADASTDKVGIGTATPGEKLTVHGNISASGDITASAFKGDGSGLTNVSATLPSGVVSSSAQIADVTLTTAAQTNITSVGTLTTLTVDDITINGSTISDGADLTIDAEGDITLDANGADVILSDDGTEFGRFKRDSSDFIIKSATNNKDIVFRGVDDSSTITALTLDMSDAGHALFTGDISGSTIRTSGDIIAGGKITGSHFLINPASAAANELVFEIKVGSTQKVFIDEDGDASFDGQITCDKLQVSSDGTTSSPAIKFGTDINTGILQPADNKIAIQADGGTAELTVSTDGVEITNGDFIINETIVHSGDTNTKIDFTTDNIQLDAGGTTGLELDITGSILHNVKQNIFDTGSVALGANGAIGDVVKFGNTTTSAGGIYYLKGDGTWALAQANAAATATGSLAIAVGTNSTTHGMCLRGFINPFSDPGAGIGSPVYLSDGFAGRFISTAPDSNNDVVRILGHQYGTDLIYFNPSNDFIVITA